MDLPSNDIDDLLDLVAGGEVLVLTGAGISTDSGIPDYRGVTGRQRPATPMTHHDFVSSRHNQRRYWARSLVGWHTFGSVVPNAGHRALASLENQGHVTGVITQNVDGLHQAAGSREVVELHGSLWRVRCLACGHHRDREVFQRDMLAANPGYSTATATVSADGDAHLTDVDSFVVIDCRCGGVLMPDIVFFGAGVPRHRVDTCYRMVEASRAMLVLGSSLHVWSGLRFVRHAAGNGVRIAIVNLGPTRGDDLADVRLDTGLSSVLDKLASRLLAATVAPIAPVAPL